jgi:hypothetical protein
MVKSEAHITQTMFDKQGQVGEVTKNCFPFAEWGFKRAKKIALQHKFQANAKIQRLITEIL